MSVPHVRSRRYETAFVYFVQYGPGGPIKIGIAGNVESRFAGFQTASPVSLELLGSVPGGIELETQLHVEFQDASCRGEWFEPTPELLDRIAELTHAS